MSNNDKICPLGCVCTQECMWSVGICNFGEPPNRAACALAVLAARGSDHVVNTIQLRKDEK